MANNVVKEIIFLIFNPIEKVVELYDEKIALYERMLKEKEEAIALLHDVLKDKK
jgi:hypothetical protein